MTPPPQGPGRAVSVPAGALDKGCRGGFHLEARAGNDLEAGWRTGRAILEHGLTGEATASP